MGIKLKENERIQQYILGGGSASKVIFTGPAKKASDFACYESYWRRVANDFAKLTIVKIVIASYLVLEFEVMDENGLLSKRLYSVDELLFTQEPKSDELEEAKKAVPTGADITEEQAQQLVKTFDILIKQHHAEE